MMYFQGQRMVQSHTHCKAIAQLACTIIGLISLDTYLVEISATQNYALVQQLAFFAFVCSAQLFLPLRYIYLPLLLLYTSSHLQVVEVSEIGTNIECLVQSEDKIFDIELSNKPLSL